MPPAASGGRAPAAFRAAAASGADWRDTARACIAELGDVAGATLGIVYLSDRLADQAGSILVLLKELTHVADWVGTVGVGVCCRERELFDEPAMAVLVGWVERDRYRLLPAAGMAAAPPIGGDDAAWIEHAQPALGLVHADPTTADLPAAIKDLSDRTGAFLVGGISSGRAGHPQICGSVVDGGLSGVLFAADVPLATGLTQGCSPIGPSHRVTEADGNVIAKLDGRPALDVLKEDIGEVLAQDLRKIGGHIFAALPVAGSDTGDYLVRNLVGIDVNGGLVAIAEEIEAGEPILFTRRDRDAAVEDLNRMVAGLKRRLGDARPKAAIYVSCLARGPNLFGEESEEVRQVQAALEGVPLVGFFANGEISHDRLYGYTGVLTVFF